MVPFLISQPLWNVPEAHVGALRLWHNEIELVRHAVDPVHLVRGEIHQPVLLLLKANVASGSPLEPQLEDVIVTAALDHLVSSVVAAVVTLVCLEEVIRRHLIAVDQEIILLYVECGALEEGAHQFVRIPRHRIGSLDPLEPLLLVFAAHEQAPAPGSVNVQPDPVLVTNIRDLRDGVVGAVHGGPGGAVDEEGQVSLLLVLDDQLLQLLGNHLAPLVTRHGDAVIQTQANGRGSALD